MFAMYGGCCIQMTTRKYTVQDKEEAFVLYSQAWSYGDIAKTMNERYAGEDYKLSKSTVHAWAKEGKWDERKEKVLKEVRNVTERKATTSIARAIKLGTKLQELFATQLNEGMDIRPSEAYAWTTKLIELEGAVEARNVLIDEVAELVSDAMDKAGIEKQKQAAFAQHYTDMVRNLQNDD